MPCYTKTPQTAVLRPRNLRGSAGTERMKPTNSSLVHQNWRCHHQTWGWERRGEELVKEKQEERERKIQTDSTLLRRKIVLLLQRSRWHCSACFQSSSHRQTQPWLLQQQEINPFSANMATNQQTGCLPRWGKLKEKLKQVTWWNKSTLGNSWEPAARSGYFQNSSTEHQAGSCQHASQPAPIYFLLWTSLNH